MKSNKPKAVSRKLPNAGMGAALAHGDQLIASRLSLIAST